MAIAGRVSRERLYEMLFFGDPHGYPPILNCARSLADAGWRVRILCRAQHIQAQSALPTTVEVRRVGDPTSTSYGEYAAFIREALRNTIGSGIVCGHDMHGLLPAAAVARRSGAPLVYHCHDFAEAGRPLPLGSRIVKALEARCARRAALTIVPDDDRGRVVRDQLHLEREVFVLPNAPRRSLSNATSALRVALASRGFGFEQVVLRQGRVGPNHGIEATLASVTRWQRPHAGLVLIGPCDTQYRARLESQIAQLGVKGRVALLDPVSYDHILSMTGDADVGHAIYEPANVNHVQMGTASNKLLEYMAAGVPIVVADTPSFMKIVGQARCGFGVVPGKPDSIALAINTLLGDPTAARKLGASGRTYFERYLEYGLHFTKLLEQIERLVARRGP